MITKLLFTAFIIVAALFFIRYKSSQSQRQEHQRQVEQATDRRAAMFIAVGLVSLMLIISAVFYYLHWQEEHRLFSVQVINSNTGAQQRYDVYQGDIKGRKFRTIDGRLINLSDIERMEVQEKVVEGNED